MSLSWNEIKARAAQFSRDWSGERTEKAEAQSFWNDFFNVFGVRRRTVASFEEKVRNIKGRFGFIDLFWRGKMLAEHKSFGQSLDKAATQAFEYIQCLKDENRDDEAPRYVVVSDFATIVLYDLEPDEGDPPILTFPLEDFPKHIHAFAFIPGYKVHRLQKEDTANIRAAELMGNIHDALAANGYSGDFLERFLVRLLFCFFAEDTGIFEPSGFTVYLEQSTQEDGSDLGPKLGKLFEVLDTPEHERQANLDELLVSLRYVDGGLFEETLRTPDCNRAIRDAILVATRFDWSRISPAVFGSLFQTVMDPDARRRCGAHYTEEENILKVLRPLFLDDLRAEFEKIKSNKSKLREFHQKLASLTFFDPACGCGNFLALAYRELRLLEIEVLEKLYRNEQKFFGTDFISQVDVDQFYGIEIVEFPVRIAETALWIMDHQMNVEASKRFGRYVVRLPLQKSAKIVHGNALRIDWNEVIPKEKCSYILGNPPYVGAKYQDAVQKEDVKLVFGKTSNAGLLDYVSCWYFKAAEYIQNTTIQVAFVSTNSITQGEQVGILGAELFRQGVKINFAYAAFVWTSEGSGKAHVHCVIIGFSLKNKPVKQIFEGEKEKITARDVRNINLYLVDAPDVLITNRSKPICAVPVINFGNQPIDGGHLILKPDERTELLRVCPEARGFIRPYVGAYEFINNIKRYCLWLKEAETSVIRSLPEIKARVEAVKKFRLESKRAATRELAKTASEFAFISHPESKYLLIPSVSSEHRDYIPMGFMPARTIASNLCLIVPGASLYHFGVLTSTMHMDWMRRVCGRLESRYRYSAKIVYNNFPWPKPTETQLKKVEEAAQTVLNTRKIHSESTLANLYAIGFMPTDLAKAHRELDHAVDRCYRSKPFKSEQERLEFLFELYETLTK
ncbi:MAG: N-6 DNA methylase [Planctomycetaceae bacterium]|nr:N-6 DNA methylase [Planctomycetaceae bacterium]